MRKIEILANEKYNGDTFKAIEDLIINKDPDFGSYINEFTKKEAVHSFRCLHTYHADKIIEEEFGGKEAFANATMYETKLQELELTKSEFEAMKENPYKKKLIKSLIILLIGIGLILGVVTLLNTKLKAFADALYLAVYVVGLYLLYDIAINLVGYFKFKSAKKYYNLTKDTNEYTKTNETREQNEL